MPKMSDHRFLTRLTWLLFAVVILLIGLTLRQSLKQIERLYQSDTLNSAIYLRDRFKQTEVFLEAMRGQAEERLRSDPQSVLTRQLYGHIEVLPEGLALDKLPAIYRPDWRATSPVTARCRPRQCAGGATSFGPEPLPLLATASQRLGSEIAWAYFTGVDNFIYLYPWIPSASFVLPAASMTSTTGRMR